MWAGLRVWMPGALGSLSLGRPVLMVMGVGLLLVIVVLEVGGFLASLATLR